MEIDYMPKDIIHIYKLYLQNKILRKIMARDNNREWNELTCALAVLSGMDNFKY